MNCNKLIIFLILGVITLISINLFNQINSEVYQFQRIWNIDLPKETRVVYTLDEHEWFGEGVQYTIFEFDDLPEELITTFSTSKENHREKNSEFETTVEQVIELFNLNIPENMKMNWNALYYWNMKTIRSVTVYIIYFPEMNQLFVVEETR